VIRPANPKTAVALAQVERYFREPIREETRTLLLHFASGDLDRGLPHVDADWDEVFREISRNHLLGLAHRYLEAWPELDLPRPEFRDWIRDAHRTNTIRMLRAQQAAVRALRRLHDDGVELIVLKGPALSQLVYPDPTLRTWNDIDLLVHERDWARVHRLLADLGHVSESGLAEPPPKLVPWAGHFHSRYFNPESRFLVEVHYDDLLDTGLAVRDLAGFWRRAIDLEVAGRPVKTLCLADHLVHLCMHVHHHGYIRLNWLSDIAFIVRDQADELDWDGVIGLATAEEVQVGAYYTLHYLQQLLGVQAPGEVMQALRPDWFRRYFHQRYMPDAAVLSLQPMPMPIFSFYFRPFMNRLVPDMLVMGRRRDKLHYLWRLFTPPRAWLFHHYHLQGSPWRYAHFVLHPLKFIYHSTVDVLRTAVRSFGRKP
jgi:hypothetical protein